MSSLSGRSSAHFDLGKHLGNRVIDGPQVLIERAQDTNLGNSSIGILHATVLCNVAPGFSGLLSTKNQGDLTLAPSKVQNHAVGSEDDDNDGDHGAGGADQMDGTLFLHP